MSEEKNKPPTPKKLRDAREDGETAKSEDATSAGVLTAAAVMLWISGGFLMDRLARLFAMVWDWLPRPDAPLAPLLIAMAGELMLLCLPFAAATMLGAVLALFLQGAVTTSMKPVMLRLEAVSPMAGLKRIFGMKAAIGAATTLLKAAVLLALLYLNLRGLLPLLVGATARSPELLGVLMWQVLMRLLFIAVGLFIVFGIIDYGIQHAMFIREHRMDDDEIKRENKEQMGNPEVKQARKELAHELLMGDAPAAVASSNMVVANPTHFAVAISYRPGGVPQVVCKGQDAAALQIRALAEQLEVPVIVNPPLARTLYKVPVGGGIPRECFQIVGLMLHWVDQMKAQPGLPQPGHGA
ncbi:EscU/YscU/HrcU family type III secretion system export apparatus switch protein [Xylophilus rhododendri]|uniref:EscU/YscU/HrcU family type III secretion system export apparatus switch protein n=1 Tax=Xylophilus rhododendri TaxID=2697032 RepID=A0A857JBC4_9BURK|nr:EscU/YscU/HrcU family type III secretion system export apparatus switch protein [Xylophilus rhododendri]QHJ00016.1 EscU/YscU/HrcU family type III secretion system export apparatus switch protein [Xylophilus rhododendri]